MVGRYCLGTLLIGVDISVDIVIMRHMQWLSRAVSTYLRLPWYSYQYTASFLRRTHSLSLNIAC